MVDTDKQVANYSKTTEEHIAAAKAKIVAVPIPKRSDYLAKDGQAGRPSYIVNEAMLDQIYRVVLAGGYEDVQIYPVLGVSKSTWYKLKKNFSIIEETIAAAYAEKEQLVNKMLNDVLLNPEHRDHSKALFDHKNREQRRLSKLQKIQVQVTHSVANPADLLSDDDLENQLENMDDVIEGEIIDDNEEENDSENE